MTHCLLHSIPPRNPSARRSLWRDRRGNVAVMTAFILPVLVTATFGGVSLTMALSKRQELTNIAQLACNRAVKPTRMKILSDEQRAARAKTYLTKLAADRKIQVDEATVTAGWLRADVTAKATIPVVENVSLGAPSFHVSATVTCEGLPPYPAKNDTILTSNFEKPDGNALPFKYGNWGVYKATEFGWEGGDGPGVEIQKLGPGGTQPIPPGSTSIYAVELDSDTQGHGNDANSSMYRTVELHKGTYRFSFLYLGRTDNAASNTVSVYLEGIRPESPKVRKLTVSRTRNEGWHLEQFDIPVTTYSLYRLTIAAEGVSDSTGGLFNNLKLEYIKRPGEV